MKLELKNNAYAVIEKGTTYGFKLEVFKPTDNVKAKGTHSSKEFFYPNLSQVVDKIMWEGLQGNEIAELVKSIEDLSFMLSKQMTDLWEATA